MGTVTFPLMDGQLTYAATLDARAYHLGETALLTLVIDNKLPHPVNGISIRFNNFISLLGPKQTQNVTANNLSSSSLSSSSNAVPIASSDDTFTESETLTLMTERYTVKPNENVKKVISVVIPQTAFSTTKYTRSVNLMAYLDVTIHVQSHTPSVSEKSFQVPIYVINKLPQREPSTHPPFLSQVTSGGSSGSITNGGSSDSLLTTSSVISSSPTVLNGSANDRTIPSPHSSFKDLSTVTPQKVAGIVIWTNDNEVSQCTICSNEFTILRRRHHCRSCGRVMCGKCGKEATVDELFGPKPQRLCTLCLAELHNLVDAQSLNSSTSSANGIVEIDEAMPSLSLSFPDESISPRNKRSSIQLLAPQRSISSSKISTASAIGAPQTSSSPPPSSASPDNVETKNPLESVQKQHDSEEKVEKQE